MKLEQAGNLHAGALGAKDGALELLVEHRESEQVELDVVLVVRSNGGGHDGAALGRNRTGLFNQLTGQDAGRQDHDVTVLAGGQLTHEAKGRFERRAGTVGGTDLLGALDLGGLEVDSDNGASTGVHGTLDGAGTNTTTTDDGDDVTGTYVAAVDGRAEAGRDTTRDQRGGTEVVPGLDADE